MADEPKAEEKDYTTAEFIEEKDRLQIENRYLQLQNLQLQQSILERQKQDLVKEIQQSQAKTTEVIATLSKKYGVRLTPNAIDKDGRIIRPQPPQPKLDLPPLPNLIAAESKN